MLSRTTPGNCGLDPLVSSTSTAPQFLDVSLRLRFGRPDPGKLPAQVDFEIEARETHHTGDLEVRRLLQGANLFPGKTTGFDLADNVVHEVRLLK